MADHVAYVLLILTQVVSLIYGGAIFKLEMRTFYSNGRDSSKLCCDLFCNNPCDPKFEFCFDNPAGERYDYEECQYGKLETGVMGNQNYIRFTENMAGILNPMEIYIPKWEGSVRVKVTILDSDHVNYDDFIDHIYDEFKVARPDYSASTGRMHTRIMKGIRPNDPTSLTVAYKVYCEDGYYGQSCDVPCAPRNNATGHYTCNPQTGAVQTITVQDSSPWWILGIIIILVLIIVILILVYVCVRRKRNRKKGTQANGTSSTQMNASSSTDAQTVSTGTTAHNNPAFEDDNKPQASSQTDPPMYPDMPPKYEDSFYDNFKNQQMSYKLPAASDDDDVEGAYDDVEGQYAGVCTGKLPEKC